MANLVSRRRAAVLVGNATLLVLFLGLVAWRLNWARSQADKTNWLHLQTDTTTWTGFFLGIGMWVGALAACLVALAFLLHFRGFLRAMAAMWRPIVIVAAAGYLLFFNDQGRELGHSLLGQNDLLPIFFLFIALFYWAANTWHSARLGIDRSLKTGVLCVALSNSSETIAERRVLRGNERWLYWPPRLLGVCAHLFAAVNLSLAAWNIPFTAPASFFGFNLPQSALEWLARNESFAIALSAPFAIAFATAFVWAEDVMRSSRQKQFASAEKLAIARVVSRASVAGAILVLSGLAYAARDSDRIPQGFLSGTISIFVSAFAFLVFISWLRNLTPPLRADASALERAGDDARQEWQIRTFTICLFAIAFVVAVLVWKFPIWFGALGSMVVAYFAFGAMLALVNAIELAIEYASARAIIKQWFGDWANPRALGAGVVAFAIVFGLVNAWLHPFHRVRLCDDNCEELAPSAAGFSVAIVPSQRPTVAEAATAWYNQAEAAFRQSGRTGPVPMLIVATAGGGIRAAYWTATILDELEDHFENQSPKQSVRPYLFAISGVSGGSVGAVAFEAALAKRDENHCMDGASDPAGKPDDPDAKCPRATSFLTEDFLAPALASLVFEDAPSSFLPDLGQGDRGAALEESFEHASSKDRLLARPFLSFFRKSDPAAPDEKQAPWWRPILLLNATHEETGNRIITSHVLIERNVFIDSLDALHMLGQDVRASTAAHNSARFTYVSPAGDLGSDQGSVIDGGYFENFGALSALELARVAKRALNDDASGHPLKTPKVKLVILMISSDPDLKSNHMLVRINGYTNNPGKCLVSVRERETPTPSPNYFLVNSEDVENALINEFVAPFQGLEKVREAHGNWAAAELAADVCIGINEGITKPQTDQRMQTNPLDLSEEAMADDSPPFDAGPESPYFAHLAMCKETTASKDPKAKKLAPIQPPLGWVLSKWTQDKFPKLLNECGNNDQLDQLETALGKPVSHHDVAQQNAPGASN